jgi:hypothetical protein
MSARRKSIATSVDCRLIGPILQPVARTVTNLQSGCVIPGCEASTKPPSALEHAALIDRVLPEFRRCAAPESRNPAGDARQPQSSPQDARVTDRSPRREAWHARDGAVGCSAEVEAFHPFFLGLSRFLTRVTIADRRWISASNARMHSSLLPCGPSGLASPHDGHTEATCGLRPSRLSTDADQSSNSTAAAKNQAISRNGVQEHRWSLCRSRTFADLEWRTLERGSSMPVQPRYRGRALFEEFPPSPGDTLRHRLRKEPVIIETMSGGL